MTARKVERKDKAKGPVCGMTENAALFDQQL